MPMSLKSMLKKFAHKGQITAEEYDALVDKLAGHDRELRASVIDEFKEETMRRFTELELTNLCYTTTDFKIILREVEEQLKGE